MTGEFCGEAFASKQRLPHEGCSDFPTPADLECPSVLSFRRHRVLPAARRLFCGQQLVEIGGRAFDLLVVLLRARGQIVSKEQIVRQVWPKTIVDESNLRFQMVLLRRALGVDRDLIKTVSGRGYLFAAEMESEPPNVCDPPEWTVPRSAYAELRATALSPANGIAVEGDGASARIEELETENHRLRRAVADLASILGQPRLGAAEWVGLPQNETAVAPMSLDAC